MGECIENIRSPHLESAIAFLSEKFILRPHVQRQPFHLSPGGKEWMEISTRSFAKGGEAVSESLAVQFWLDRVLYTARAMGPEYRIIDWRVEPVLSIEDGSFNVYSRLGFATGNEDVPVYEGIVDYVLQNKLQTQHDLLAAEVEALKKKLSPRPRGRPAKQKGG